MVSLNTNISSLNAQRLVNINAAHLAKTTERLSSGLRINNASDDPSGLGISQVLTSQIRGDTMATNNLQQASSMLQVADAALSNIGDILQRMRELAVQGNNTALSTSQANSLQAEFSSLTTAITNITSGVTFNGIALLTGGTGTVTLQIGAATTATTTIGFGTDFRANQSTIGTSTLSVASAAAAAVATTALDTAISNLSTARGNFGAKSQELGYLKGALDSTIIANTDARARITDADVASEVSNLVRQQLIQQAGTSALAAANFSAQFVVSLLR